MSVTSRSFPLIKYMFAEQLGVRCGVEYKEKMAEFNTKEELDAWKCTLAEDVARLDGLDTQESAARKVIDLEDELVKVVCPPHFTMLSGSLLTILIRAAPLRGTISTSYFLFALSIHTASKRRQCLVLA